MTGERRGIFARETDLAAVLEAPAMRPDKRKDG